MNDIFHKPVMLNEVLATLDPKPNQHFVDATLGLGGHAAAILERTAPDGVLIGIERDPEMLALARKRLVSFGSRFMSFCATYDRIYELARAHHVRPIAGVLFDLGMSSWHLEHSGRGFSFLRDEPLDMRFNPAEAGQTAADIIRTFSREELARIFRDYGEEPRAALIADLIVKERRRRAITTTSQLAALIEKTAPARPDGHSGGPRRSRARIHAATKVFQALRIAVNGELELLERGLSAAFDVLVPKGKIAVITFQGLEARIVKQSFRDWEKAEKGKRTTKHAIAPLRDEIKENPRARSAHLYCFQHI